MRYSELTWYAPKKPRRRSKFRRRVLKYTMPTLAVLLFVITGATTVKIFLWDRIMKKKPSKPVVEEAAPPAMSILDADIVTIDLLLNPKTEIKTYTYRVGVADQSVDPTRASMPASGPEGSIHSKAYADADTVLDLRSMVQERAARSTERALHEGADSSKTLKVPKELPKQMASVQPKSLSVPPKSVALAPPTSTISASSRAEDKLKEAKRKFAKADRRYKAGDFAEAETICLELLKEAPDLVGVHNMLGETYSRQRKWKEAAAQFEKAVDEDPKNAEPYNNLGLVLSQMDDDDRAEKYLRDANKLDPMNQTVLMNLAWHLRKMKRYPEALVYLDSCLVVDPDNAKVRNKWIQTLLDMGNYEKVKKEIEGQLDKNPRNPQAMMMMAVMFTRQGNVDLAIEWLRKAEALTTPQGMRTMLERINDFDAIKDTPQYQAYLQSLTQPS